MAANNYFGFAHAGTQYSAQPAGTYPAAQTAYVQPAHQAAYATAAPRAATTYDTYQTTHTTGGTYAYAARTPQAPPPPPATTQTYAEPYYAARATQPVTYDTTKTYYQPAHTTYTVAETHYQAAAKPVYAASTTYNATHNTRPAAAQKTQAAATSSASTYVYPSATTTAAAAAATTTFPTTTTASSYTAVGYDAALYSAATNYYQQQQAAKTGTAWAYKKGTVATKKIPPKTVKGPQLHYCDVCKISCAGPQTYREHLEGQKHKKKEAATKTGTTTTTSGRAGQNQLRCELCDVSCTGADAYAAHIRGAKHQKVLKLHTKLGKPIPSTDPTVVTSSSSASSKSTTSTAMTSGVTVGGKPISKTLTPVVSASKKVLVATPKITFVGGTQLKTTGAKTEEVKTVEKTPEVEDKSEDDGKLNIPGEKDVQPVGHEYIEEVKNEAGKTISFNCKLCECKFNDPNAKEMHMKGRRHRLQYKKKVDPSLMVEVKPSIRARKIQEEKLKRQAQREEYWRRRDQEESRMEEEMYWEEMRRYEEMEYLEWQRRSGGRGMPPRPFPPQSHMGMHMRRPDSSDDRHAMSKHAGIYPNEAELQAVQNIVSSVEKALKCVSDFIADTDSPTPTKETVTVKTEVKVKKKKVPTATLR